MKVNIRWQILLAVLGFVLVAALLSVQVQSAGFCTVRVPAAGGSFSEGLVGAPQYLNPLLSDNNPVDRELVSLIFDGLTRYEYGAFVPALAESWEVSEDGRIVRFTLRNDIFWQDGEPVTVADVAFTYGLLQDPEFPGNSALQRFWETVIIRPVSDTVIEFELLEPYAPFLDAVSRGILPAHRLEGVTAVALPGASFNREPIGTGPFVVVAGQNWERSRALQLTPNPAVWQQGTQISNLEFRFYSDESELLAAYDAGEIQAINDISPDSLPDAIQQKDMRLFTSIAPRYTSLLFNLTDSGAAAARNADVRKALAFALDKQRLVDLVLNGQGVVHNGPYLPSSWAYNSGLLTDYTYQPELAAQTLDAAGWGMQPDQTSRARENEGLLLRLLVLDSPTNRALAEEIAAQWGAVGAASELVLISDWQDFRSALAARDFDVVLVDIVPPDDPDLYDFWSQEAIVRGQNYAGWNRRRASEALEDGRKVWSEAERRPFYDSFQRLYNEDLPELTLFQHITTFGVNENVREVEIGRIDTPRDKYSSLARWSLLFRDVTVACPADEA